MQRIILITYLILLISSGQLFAKDETIKIGVLHSQRGTMAISERSLVESIKMAVDEINKNGGVLNKKIEAIIEDGESDWPTFAQKAKKLIYQDKVSSVFGCWTSASRKAVLPVFEESNNLLWYPVQYEGGESSKNIIYTGAAPNQQIIPAVKWSMKKLGKKFFLVGSDYIFPRRANKIIRKTLSDNGGHVVGEEYIQLGDQNSEEIVRMIVESKPDVIFNTINGDSNRGFFEHLKKLNTSNIPVISVSIAEDELIQLDIEKTKGHYAAWNYFQSIDTETNTKFVNRFKSLYGSGRVTDDPIEAAYFQVHLFAKAVEKAKSIDPEKIREAVKDLTFTAPGGKIKIDKENQHTWKKSRIGQIKEDGQFRIVWESKELIKPEPYLKEGRDIFLSRTKEIKSQIENIEYQLENKSQQNSVLAHALKSEHSEVRLYAVTKVGDIKDISQKSIRTLSKLVNDKDLLVSQQSIDSLKKIGYKSKNSLPELVKGLSHKIAGVRLRSKMAIVHIASELKKENDYSKLNDIIDALSIIKNDNDQYLYTLQLIYAYLDDYKKDDYLKKLVDNIKKPLLVIPIVLLVCYLFLSQIGTRLFPFFIIKFNSFVESKLDINYKGLTFKVPLHYLLLIGFFLTHKRVQNAWIERNIYTASDNFKKYGTVKYREVYIPIPVTLNDTSHDHIKAEDFKSICKKDRWLIHILGQGGVGKTALACQFALWAMNNNSKLSIFNNHKAIPILIEPGVGHDVINNIAKLKSVILGQLKALINTNEEINQRFFEGLLKYKYLVVIIDDITTVGGYGWNLTSSDSFPISALIITSRTDEQFGNIPTNKVRPLDVSGEKLSSFMDAYLMRRNYRAQFTDNEFFKACRQLTNIVGENSDSRQMTVLFAKMYAEQLIGMKEKGTMNQLPASIPNLMVGYVNELNKSNQNKLFNDYNTLNNAKILAWECTKDILSPSVADKSDVISHLDHDSDKVLEYFENNLQLIQVTGTSNDGIKFTIDPLAEYLAALHLIDINKNDVSLWNKFFSKVELKYGNKYNKEIKWFLLALRDCCIENEKVKIPHTIVKDIERILGLDNKISSIKVGILHSLTGNMSISERSLIDSIQMAIAEINDNNGVLNTKIKAIIEDGKSDWPTFAKQAKKLIEEDKVCSVFGCWTSASRKEVLPIFEEYNNLLWYPVQYEGNESSLNVIYTGASPNQQIIPAIDWCAENLGNTFFLVGSDYIFPREANKLIKEVLKKPGFKVVGEEYKKLGEQDFKDIVQKIVDVKPSVIFNTLNGDSNRGFFQHLYDANKKDTPVMSVSIAEDELMNIGHEITSGHYCAWSYFQSIDTPENERFVKAFKKTNGPYSVTDDPIEAAYFQVHLFAKAVEMAESILPQAIRNAARGLAVSAPGGTVKIDKENQHVWKRARIGKIQDDGQFDIVWESPGLIKPDPYILEKIIEGSTCPVDIKGNNIYSLNSNHT